MWYPQNPKVLIVDDHYDEVEPLLRMFSLEGIPYVYIDGSKNAVPTSPFLGIRLVILDVELDDRTPSGSDDNSIGSALASYLSELIDIKNSPYALLFWTKRPSVIERMMYYLSTQNGSPIVYKNMDKPAKGDFDLEKVKNDFFSSFGNETFDFLINWEDSISKNAAKFVNAISNIAKQESVANKEEWGYSMNGVLSKLASSYLGTKKIAMSEIKDAVRYAIEIFNKSFLEELKIDDYPQLVLPEKAQLSLDTIAKLNEFLFIECINDKIIDNGKVFLCKNEKTHDILKKTIIRNSELDKWETNLIAVILTPNCDLAHNKFLKDENKIEYHRTLFGLKIIIQDSADICFEYNAKRSTRKKDINSIIETDVSFSKAIADCISSRGFKECAEEELRALEQKIKKLAQIKTKIMERFPEERPEYLYITEPFMDSDNKIAIFAFHFGTITTIPIDPSKISFSYLMKNDLISDLQTKLANHVNRLGHSMLDL